MSSVTKRNGSQVCLPRFGEECSRVIADGLAEIYPESTSTRTVHHGYKLAAIVSLKTSGGWTFEQLGRLFGHPKGHVQRLFKTAVLACRERFQLNPLLGRQEADTDAEPLPLTEGDLNHQFGSLSYDLKRQALAAVLGEPPV